MTHFYAFHEVYLIIQRQPFLNVVHYIRLLDRNLGERESARMDGQCGKAFHTAPPPEKKKLWEKQHIYGDDVAYQDSAKSASSMGVGTNFKIKERVVFIAHKSMQKTF